MITITHAAKSTLAVLASLSLVLAFIHLSASPAYGAETARVLVQFAGPVTANDAAFVRGLGGEVLYEYDLVLAIAAEVPVQALPGLERNPRVTLIEEDVEVQATAVTPITDIADEYGETWSIANIDAKPAHDAGTVGAGVKVGIIDSGISNSHPDLNVVGEHDFVNNSPTSDDVYGHGTHVAGTACGLMNGWGVVGVAPACDLYDLRVLNDDGVGYTSSILAAVEWATANDLDVINLSLGSSRNPGLTAEAVYNAANDAGVLVVAAAGNSGRNNGKGNNTIYPANFASVVAVAATDRYGDRAYFSSTGDVVELAAPGYSVHSAWNDGDSPYDPQPACFATYGCYKDGSGTSMASPQVAGAAAVIISAGIGDGNGDGKINDDVRALLQATAIDLGQAGRDTEYGFGLINVADAVAAVVPAGPQAPVADAGGDQTVSDSNGDGLVLVTVDGIGSSDVDGTIVSYDWDLDGDTVADYSGVSTTLSLAPSTTPYVVTLTVTDSDGLSDSDTATITVLPNQAPVANAGADQVVEDVDGSGAESVTLDGSASQDDGTLSYSWTRAGVEVATVAQPTLDVAVGTTEFILTVTDEAGLASSDTVSVTVVEPPAISLTLSGTKDKGRNTVTLDWVGTTAALVDIYRDGSLYDEDVSDVGTYVDTTGERGSATYSYQVCEADSAIQCSSVRSFSF